MGNKVVQLNGKILTVDDTEYKLTPGLRALVTLKQPQPSKWTLNDYREYKKTVAQTRVRSFPNRTGTTQPHATWKWKTLLKHMVIHVERIPEGEGEEEEGSGDTDDATSSVEDPGLSSHRSLSDMFSSVFTSLCTTITYLYSLSLFITTAITCRYSFLWKS